MDVVQGLREANWEFKTAAELRAFLVKVTRNRFLDHLRLHDRTLDHEELVPAGNLENIPGPTLSTPSKQAQADELWQRLLELCPVEHRPILRMKRGGASSEEIVAATGLHPGSVRRILRQLASQLANLC